MKKVILTQQYLGYPKGTELIFITDSEADELIAKDKAVSKSIDNPPKDKMLRNYKRK